MPTSAALEYSKTSTRSSAYSPGFETALERNGIHPEGGDYLPENFGDIQRRIAVPRPSLSSSVFTNEKVRDFQDQMRNAGRFSEMGVQIGAMPTMRGSNWRHPNASNLPFNNLNPLIPHEQLPPARPDFYTGARPGLLDQRICNELSGTIQPSTRGNAPILPNFTTEFKGPSGTTEVLQRQATYNGAHGTRAMRALESHGLNQMAEPGYQNKAHTVSSTFSDGHLQLYAHHVRGPTSGNGPLPSYQMTILDGYSLFGSPPHVREGLTAYRNAMDLAAEHRTRAIDGANQRLIQPLPTRWPRGAHRDSSEGSP